MHERFEIAWHGDTVATRIPRISQQHGINTPEATPVVINYSHNRIAPNAGLQLRRAISIQGEGKRLLEKHAVAPSAARLRWLARPKHLGRPQLALIPKH